MLAHHAPARPAPCFIDSLSLHTHLGNDSTADADVLALRAQRIVAASFAPCRARLVILEGPFS